MPAPDPLADLRMRLGDAADDTARRVLVTAVLRARKHAEPPQVLLGRWAEEGKEAPARLFAWRGTPLGNLVLVLSSRSGWRLLHAEDVEESAPSCFRVRPPKPPAVAGPLRFFLPHPAKVERNRDALLRALLPLGLPLRLPCAPQSQVAVAVAAIQPFLAVVALTPLRA
jgi:hypothetical protein